MYLPIIMLVCGIIGGVTVHVTTSKKPLFGKEFTGNVLYGVIAAFLVPLFLNTISSQLINEIDKEFKNIYVFIGFCLIASMSSKVFITNLTKKTLDALKAEQDTLKANQDALKVNQDNANNTVESILAKMSYMPVESGNIETLVNNKNYLKSIDNIESKLLFELGKNEKIFITVSALSKKITTTEDVINEKLDKMIKERLVNKVDVGGALAYGLTIKGIKQYKNLVNSMDWTVKELTQGQSKGLKRTYKLQLEHDSYKHEVTIHSEEDFNEVSPEDKITLNTFEGNNVDAKNVFKK